MSDARQWIPLAGLAATIATAIAIVTGLDDRRPSLSGDYSRAATAEVRDMQGRIVLQGSFGPLYEDIDEFERTAPLTATDVEGGAIGEAEVEVAKEARRQEIELTILNMRADSPYVLRIDGRDVATTRTNREGRAELELQHEPPAAQ